MADSKQSTDNLKIDPKILELQKTLANGKNVIGIDIGISSVNVVQAAMYKGKPTIIRIAVENIGLINDQERDQATIEALKKALSKFNTEKANVVCVVPNQKTMVDYVSMPVMPEKDLVEAVRLEVSSSEHFPIEHPVVDCQPVGRFTIKGVEKINVMAAVTAQGTLDGLLNKFKSQQANRKGDLKSFLQIEDLMGLNMIKAIPVCIALENIIKNAKTKETVAALEMGSMSSELSIYRDGVLEFSRKINVTGMDLTRSLTSALFTNSGKIELTIAEAEKVKKDHGIPIASDEFLVPGKVTSAQALSLLRPKLEQLLREINRSFDFYHDRSQDSKIDRMILFGGAALMQRLPNFLNTELGLPVSLGNPLQDIAVLSEDLLSDKESIQTMTLAIGASLSDEKGINLLPENLRNSKNKFLKILLAGILTIIVVVSSIFTYLSLLLQLNIEKQQDEKTKKDYQTLIPRLQDLKSKLLIESLAHERLDIGGLLRELSNASENISFVSFSIKDGRFSLSGNVKASERETKKILLPLINEFKKTSLQNVKVSSIMEAMDKSKSSFTITAILGSEGGNS